MGKEMKESAESWDQYSKNRTQLGSAQLKFNRIPTLSLKQERRVGTLSSRLAAAAHWTNSLKFDRNNELNIPNIQNYLIVSFLKNCNSLNSKFWNILTNFGITRYNPNSDLRKKNFTLPIFFLYILIMILLYPINQIG